MRGFKRPGAQRNAAPGPFHSLFLTSLGPAILPAGPARDGADPLQAMLEALPKERQTPA